MNNLFCTIIITSYNKADFIAATIESALAQDYPNLEVVVVDDGSRDESLSVIRRYQSRVTILAKPNGGQASAINAGYPLAHGDVVFLLDSDDTLLPDTVSRVAATWRPDMSKVHFKLQKMRADGTPIQGAFIPPYGPLPRGDLRPLLRRFGFYPSSPTSGNAFSRRYLNAVLPIEEDSYRFSADTFLIGLAPLHGKIGALESFGGHWRHTGQNISHGGLPTLEAMLRCELRMIAAIRNELKIGDRCRHYRGRWPQHLKNQIVVSKFGRTGRVPNARLRTLLLSYIKTVAIWPEYRLATRIKFVVWAIIIGVTPEHILRTIPGVAGQTIDVSRVKQVDKDVLDTTSEKPESPHYDGSGGQAPMPSRNCGADPRSEASTTSTMTAKVS